AVQLQYWGSGMNPNGGTCPTIPSGVDASQPTGMLCKVTYPFNNPSGPAASSSYFYKTPTGNPQSTYAQLARIVDPGGATADFGYDDHARLNTLREALA